MSHAPTLPALTPAVRAPPRLIGKTFLREELLLTLGEHELLAAIPTGQNLVRQLDSSQVFHGNQVGFFAEPSSIATHFTM